MKFATILFVIVILSLFSPPAQYVSTPPTLTGQVFTNKNLAGNVSVPATTLTTIDSISVTMPSSGCPCRALVTYSYAFANGGSQFQSQVTDGVNLFAQYNSNVANSSISGSMWSPVTYANNAAVTFTVQMQDGSAATVNTANAIGTPSAMQAMVVTSK